MSGSYTVNIRFICYTSVTRTLVDSSLSGTYALLTTSVTTYTALPPPDKRFLYFFCLFGVRYLYPVICDSTISSDSHFNLLSKHLFYIFILNNHVFAVYFRKKWIYLRHGVDVSDDITITKAVRRVNGLVF